MEIQKEWNIQGEKYASDMNELYDFVDKNGWENWKGKEPKDEREYLSDSIIKLLKEANDANLVENFRKEYPPFHSPFIKYFEENGQYIEQMFFIENEKIIFVVRTDQNRVAYLLDGKTLTKLNKNIELIGKSNKNEIFALKKSGLIITTKGWNGEIIETFNLEIINDYFISKLIPFNDGKKVLCVSSNGIFLLTKDETKMIHPIPNYEDEDWDSILNMENAALSNDNQYIVVGDQASNHRILNQNYEQIGEVGPQSDYIHFCLFSKDDSQLISNSCRFNYGTTIGIDVNKLNGLFIEEYKQSDNYCLIDDEFRVFVGLATENYYILGESCGFIKAIDKNGKCVWRHYLGSTITGLAISNDEKTLWVGSYSGMLHKLKLGLGHRESHTIGNGNHYEEFRLILWKNEPKELWW